MTTGTGQEPAGAGRRTAQGSGTATRTSWPAWPWPELAVLVAAAAVYSWQVGTPSLWRDEAATLAVARRTPGQMLDVFRVEDLVHAVYYALVHLVLLVDDSVLAVRVFSVAAFALTAALLVRIGRRLGTTPVGVTAGLLLAVCPIASRFAQEARSVALVALVATAATSLFLRRLTSRLPVAGVSGRHAADVPARIWPAYALCVAALGWLNLVAMLLLAAHLAVLLLLGRRHARPGSLRPFVLSAGLAVLLVVPMVVASWGQRRQIGFLTAPGTGELTSYVVFLAGNRLLVPVLALAVVAVLVLHRGLPPGPAGAAFVVGGVWAVLPPALLWGLSQLQPTWDEHYVVYCVPGAMLLFASLPFLLLTPRSAGSTGSAGSAGSAAPTALRWAPAAAAVLVLATAGLGIGEQRAFRDADTGHQDDLRDASQFLAENARAGDALLFARSRTRRVVDCYPAAYRALADVALARTGLQSGTIDGVEVEPSALDAAMAGSRRVWFLRLEGQPDAKAAGTDAAKVTVLATHYRAVSTQTMGTTTVTLYERT